MYQPAATDWPHKPSAFDAADDFAYGNTVEACEAQVRAGFLRKVFGIVATQLMITAAVASMMMFSASIRGIALHNPSMLMLTFFASLGFLFAAQIHKDHHPRNLYYTSASPCMAWSVRTICCASRGRTGLGRPGGDRTDRLRHGRSHCVHPSLQAGFVFLGAGLGAALWVLILWLHCTTARSGFHCAWPSRCGGLLLIHCLRCAPHLEALAR